MSRIIFSEWILSALIHMIFKVYILSEVIYFFIMRNWVQLIIIEKLRNCSDTVQLIDISDYPSDVEIKIFSEQEIFFWHLRKISFDINIFVISDTNVFWALILHCFILSSSYRLKTIMLWYQKFFTLIPLALKLKHFSLIHFLIMTKRGRKGNFD